MARRRRRRRNPSNQTLIYVGAGLAILGVGWILYQQSQAQQIQVQQLPPPPPPPGSSAGTVVAALSPYADCIASGKPVAQCLGLSTS